MFQRGLAYAAAAVMIVAVGIALFQLATQILSFSSPVVIVVATLVAAVLIHSLRRRLRSMARRRSGPRHPHGVH
jgi:membrane protein implicated in regulation of membrane protease activity